MQIVIFETNKKTNNQSEKKKNRNQTLGRNKTKFKTRDRGA